MDLAAEDLYIQFFPPHLQDMTSPAEFMLQQMARAAWTWPCSRTRACTVA
jgi:hypothetical protein